jgi:hypothetical protein
MSNILSRKVRGTFETDKREDRGKQRSQCTMKVEIGVMWLPSRNVDKPGEAGRGREQIALRVSNESEALLTP